ncbi:M16 family metallopeptidase [Mucilaginibacter aquatilis]|uniref:Insulinase family protein n=1 Tax=Mucilaginibacter aquatilis TaxID=1517760 RepID=A0A6I4IPF5_9SPHI|nr:pitrilysin family protein [Mucilaginibacter aquatilis]MVN89903.1 insulinase family protein [Mucilaginibacter aquatilis]
MLNRTVAPESQAVNHINLIEPGHAALPNGCQVYWFNSGDQDLVRVEWIFNNLRFDKQKPLLNMAVNTMLTEGTANLTAAQIADSIDYYGAFLQAEYGYDQSQLTLYSLNRHLEHTLPVVVDVLTNSQFPQNELDTFVRNQQQKLQVSLQKNDILARRAFNKAVYSDTIYGLSANAIDYQQLQRTDMLSHFKQMYQPANCTLVISGKVDEATLQQVTGAFANWQNSFEPADTTQPSITPVTERFFYTEKPEALQSAIRMGLPMVNRSHPDFPALQVLNTVLGGYFGSRLMANIREDKGYTYGIGSGISSLKHGAAFFIATEVGADVCRSAVEEIEKEINLLRSELISEEELSLVKNYMQGSLLGSLENVFSHADKFKNVYFSGLGFDYYDRYTEVIKSITAEELQTLANKYLNFDEFYKVIVGKY